MSSKAIGSFQDRVLETLQRMRTEASQLASSQKEGASSNAGGSFLDHLQSNIKDINKSQITSDKMSMELSTGQSTNIHETMLAASQAELSFNLMVQVRNKALEAYNEIMRMPV